MIGVKISSMANPILPPFTTIEVGLDIATRVFEVTGARASANAVGLDIFWRNLRTHSLHDPVAHKRAEVGRYVLLDELPTPTWYP